MVPESALSGSRLFVLSNLDGRSIFCLAAQVGSAFEIKEGRFAGEILLQLSPEHTIQTTSRALAKNWVVEAPSIEVGSLTRCPLTLAQRLEALLRSAWVTRTALPTTRQRGRRWTAPFNHVAVRALVTEVLRDRPLDSLERHYLDKSLSPIGSEAFRRVELTDPSCSEELAKIISFNDPLIEHFPSSVKPSVDRAVDGALVPVNPDSIVSRRFLPTDAEIDLTERLKKVEHAEGVHQRTVRRLARGISALGLTPLASTSVDLAFVLPGGLVLIEVKSIHPENIETQLLKAVGQLLFYESEIAQAVGSSVVRGHIILASESALILPESFYRLANRAGVGFEHVVVLVADESPLVELAERLIARGLWLR